MSNYTFKKKCRDLSLTIVAYFLYYGLRYLVPLKVASRLGYFLGYYFLSKIDFKKKERALNNISHIFPEKNKEDVLNIYRLSCTNFVQTLFELPKITKMNEYITINDPHHLFNTFKDPFKPILGFTAHYGNWEIIGLPFLEIPGYGIYKPPTNKYINNLFLKLRLQHTKDCNFKMLTLNKNNILKLMFKAKQQNLKLLMLVDQKVKEGILADFLGKPAYTTHLLPLLAIKYKIPLVPIYVKRDFKNKNLHFTINIEKPLDLQNLTNTPKNIITATELMNNVIGEWIKNDPTQWFWLYSRW